MDAGLLSGAALILAGGALQGTFAVPMKYARRWNYENIWLIFAASGLVVFPWVLTAWTVPRLADVYAAASAKSLLAIILFGVCWGAGATLTGLGLRMLGIGLGLAVILGLSASVGSLVPLLVLTPEKLATAQGRLYMEGTGIMLAGIGVAAWAGALRQRAARDSGPAAPEGPAGGSFAASLAVAIAAGVLSSMLNFCYAFGTDALDTARRLGVSSAWASNVIAAPATSGGFLANLLYCSYLLRRNATASNFWLAGTGRNWLFGILMGAFWFGGLSLYGVGVYRMGHFGTVAGWPLLMGTIIVSSNVAGAATGEWRGAGRRAGIYLAAGMTIILVALWILALAQQP